MTDISTTIANFLLNPDGIVFLLGLFVSLGIILAAYTIHRTKVLAFGVFVGITAIAEYYVAGTYAALAIGAVGLVRTTGLLVAHKIPKLWFFEHWIASTFFMGAYPLVFLALNDLSTIEWFSFLPLLAAWLNVIAFWTKDMLITKNVQIVVATVWLTYEATTGLYTQMIGEVIAMIGLIVSVVTLVKGRKAGQQDEDIQDIEDILSQTLTEAIPVLTGAIPTITKPLAVLTQTHSIPVQDAGFSPADTTRPIRIQ